MDTQALAELILLAEPGEGHDRGPAAVLCLVHNESDILPAFLDHYRTLGVRDFVFIEHKSTDGTQNLLLGEKGVTLYRAQGSYRTSFDGLNWLNAVGRKHCAGRWTIAVDADEFLLLPTGMDGGVGRFNRQLETELSLGLFCPLVDFYPDASAGQGEPAPTENFADLLRFTPYFFPAESVSMKPISHYPYVELRSRVREQVTATAGYIPPLGKIPLFFWHSGFELKRSTHEGSSLPLSDRTGVLCHFKYRPGACRRAKLELDLGDRQDMTPVRSVLNCSRSKDLKPRMAKAHRFRGVGDLAAAGWFGGAEAAFPRFWVRANRSREAWVCRFVEHGGESLAAIEEAASVQTLCEELIGSPAWRATRPLRSFLVDRKLIGLRHLPEKYPDPKGPTFMIRFITGSIWWDIAWPIRLLQRLGRRKRWRLL